MMKITVTIALFITIMSTVFAGAQTDAEKENTIKTYNNAIEALDINTAIQIITPLAEAGDADGQYFLGHAHKVNNFFRADENTIKWFLLAAEQGHVKASYELITIYRLGFGTEGSDEKADYWTAKSVEQQTKLADAGDAEAQFKLGKIYSDGLWDGHDYDQAVAWYSKAVEQNHGEAQYELAEIYTIGLGDHRIPAGNVVALYTQAERNGIELAASARDEFIQKVQGYVQAAQASYQAQDFTAAFNSYLDAAIYQVPDALYAVGILYYQGTGTQKNNDKAIEYLKKATNQNHARAALDLGKIYMETGDLDNASITFVALAENMLRAGNASDFQTVLDLLDQLANEHNHAMSREMATELRGRR